MDLTIVQTVLIVAAAVIVTVAVCWVAFTASARMKVEYMLDALEDNETNFRFRESKVLGRKMNRTLNRLKRIFEKETDIIRSQEKYYAQMLENVQTGIVAVEEKDGHVVYANSRALDMLGVSSIINLRQLRRIDQSLYEAFVNTGEGYEERTSYFTESEKKTVSISVSSAFLADKRVKIIAFNDISASMEETETASWTRLVRVLTHEIMNTASPIASLSDSLVHARGEDLITGLETISASAKGLIKFVGSYRSLTHIAQPSKKAFELKELIERVRSLVGNDLAAAQAVMTYTELSEDILLYADEDQIAQILINLVKNALQAGAGRIDVTALIDSRESVEVNVANDGMPVSEESREEIFVPFYTTKQSGTGIGLSISRQIMRMHGGSLRLKSSDKSSTVFTLIFR